LIGLKRFAAIILLVALVVLSFTACGSGGRDNKTADNSGIADKGIEFKELGDEELPQDIKIEIENLKHRRGYASFETEEGLILFIAMGERNTTGYEIKVKSVEKVDGTTTITVIERQPGKDELVGEAITYPYTVISLRKSTGSFRVVNESGDEFGLLIPSETIEAEGEYVGQIDGSSIEVIIGGIPQAFRYEKEGVKPPVIDTLNEGDRIRFEYFENEHGQKIISNIEKV